MKKSVQAALEAGIKVRRAILSQLSVGQRSALLESLFADFFGDQHVLMQKWAALTGQSAQVDTGYISQFVASIVLQIPGQGFRGKGDDLTDGSEVKAAANISGVDRPRWNHNLGTVAQDAIRRKEKKPTTGEQYLSVPFVFYLLADRSASDTRIPHPIRVRGWLIDAQNDVAWRSLLTDFLESRTGSKYNLQLHPPVGRDDDIVVNMLGNLDFKDVLVFDANILRTQTGDISVEWRVPLPEKAIPVIGRTKRTPWGGRNDRPSVHTDASDLVTDIVWLPSLFPGILGEDLESQLEARSFTEAVTDSFDGSADSDNS